MMCRQTDEAKVIKTKKQAKYLSAEWNRSFSKRFFFLPREKEEERKKEGKKKKKKVLAVKTYFPRF